jgi:hypothetical protein
VLTHAIEQPANNQLQRTALGAGEIGVAGVTNTSGIIIVENWFEDLMRLVPTTR